MAVALVFAAAGAYVFFRVTRPSLPRIERLGSMAPEVADAARQALELLEQNPRDAARWSRFGMVCEANGLIGAARDAYVTATSLDGSEEPWRHRPGLRAARAAHDGGRSVDVRLATERPPPS